MFRLGITGGIGAGKSFVARQLTTQFGVPVYDCDREAKRIMVEEAELRRQLMALVGSEAYHADGSLNRRVMSDFLFSSPLHTAQVNALVHPAVKADVQRWFDMLEHSDEPPAVAAVESAILIEAGFVDAVEALLVVEAPQNLRMERVCRRDDTTPRQVEARMAAQMSSHLRLQQASYVIINDGRDLRGQLASLPFLLNTKHHNSLC